MEWLVNFGFVSLIVLITAKAVLAVDEIVMRVAYRRAKRLKLNAPNPT